MAKQLFWIAVCAAVSGLSVPAMVLFLARLGRFEPIRFNAFGYHWDFSPIASQDVSTDTVAILMFPRHAVFASAVTVVCTIAAPPGLSTGWQQESRAYSSGEVRELRRLD